MKNYAFLKPILIGLFALIFVWDGAATDGYFSNGVGTKNKSMAGAGVAFLTNPFSAANNPAGIGFLENFQIEVAFAVFNPNRQYTVTGAPTPSPYTFGLTEGNIESESKYFFIPTIAATFKLGEKNSIGVNIFGNGGMNTDYPTRTYYNDVSYAIFGGDQSPTNPFGGITQPTGINLTQLFVSATYARRFGNHSIGISPVFVYQTFEAKGLEAFSNFQMAGANSDKITGNGSETSTGFGFKIGYQGELFEGFRLGATFQPRINMSEFEEYKGLFADGGKFDIPMTWTAGVSYDFNEHFTLLFDVRQIMYSEIKSVANPLVPSTALPLNPNPDANPMDPNTWFIPNESFVPLGDENGAGFGWEDMFVFKVGAEFRKLENWDFRLGYSHGEQPIGEDDVLFNILAPAVVQDHLTLGFTRAFGKRALHFSFMYALNNAVKGPNPFDPAQEIEIEMNQMEFEVAFTF
jgi:long-chain fatty acid transport protein